MLIGHYSEIGAETFETLPGVRLRWLIDEREGKLNFLLRRFELDKNAKTPHHKHPWEHEIYVISGTIELTLDEEKIILKKDSFAYIPENHMHQFKNIGEEEAVFLCIIPRKGAMDRKYS